jgi:DNA-binding CsgD family transcriptional regulator
VLHRRADRAIGAALGREVARAIPGAPLSSGAPAAAALSAREREVLALVATGLTDAQVARRLALSPHTVHRHVSNIRTKLAVPSRSAAVAWWSREGAGSG